MRTLKWIYDLGKLHERRRIELAIRKYRHPNLVDDWGFMNEKERKRQEDKNNEIEAAVRNILYPMRNEHVVIEKSVLDD